MTSIIIVAASIVTGLIVGWWLTMVVATTAMSRSQERMEKRVRNWQNRAVSPRSVDDIGFGQETLDYWPEAMSGSTSTWPNGG